MKKEQLFLLIKSLSKSERRYFKLFVSSAEPNTTYLKLFTFISKQDLYDESLVKSHFKNEAFVRQLHVAKNYLHNLILKSLRNFYTEVSKEAELHDLLRDTEILFRRELFRQCSDRVKKAYSIALKYEKYSHLLQICDWHRRLLLAQNDPNRNDLLNEVLSTEQGALKKLDKTHRYWYLTLNMFDLMPTSARDTKIAEDVTKAHSLLKDVATADSIQSRILYYHVLQTYYSFNGRMDLSESYASSLISMLEASPDFIRENPSSYITALNNKIGLYLRIKKFDAIPEILSKIRSIPSQYKLKSNSHLAVRTILQTYNVELELYRDTEQVNEGIALIDHIKEYLVKYGHQMRESYTILFHYQFAYLYFMKKDYTQSLHWINEILNRKKDDLTREDIQSFARFLNLIIHFELDNITILLYAVESCRRFLRRKRNLHDFERVLLRFFTRIGTSPDKEYPELLKSLRQELFANTDEKLKANTLDYLNFEKWMDEKINAYAT